MVTLTAPPGAAVFRKIHFNSGTVAHPHFRGSTIADPVTVTVEKETDALELEAEGWVREPRDMAKHAPIFANARLRTNLDAMAKRYPELAKAIKDLSERAEAMGQQIDAIKPLPIDAPYVWKTTPGVANGAQHRGVRGIHESAERAYE